MGLGLGEDAGVKAEEIALPGDGSAAAGTDVGIGEGETRAAGDDDAGLVVFTGGKIELITGCGALR